MIPNDLPFDQITLLPDDWDEVEDGEIDLAVRLETLADSAERM